MDSCYLRVVNKICKGSLDRLDVFLFVRMPYLYVVDDKIYNGSPVDAYLFCWLLSRIFVNTFFDGNLC